MNTVYSFEVWGQQLLDFIEQKIGEPTFIITNSVGGEARHPVLQGFICAPLSWDILYLRFWDSLYGAISFWQKYESFLPRQGVIFVMKGPGTQGWQYQSAGDRQ